jgi:hypothetical protein
MSERVHPPTGLSDEAATAEYDLIHQAEAEEQKLHPKDSMTEDPGQQTTPSPATHSEVKSERRGSKFGKMKDTLLGKHK